MKQSLIFSLLVLAILTACKKKSVNCGLECSSTEELLFNFGFEGVTLTQDDNWAYISGLDTAFSDHNNWDEWVDNIHGNLKIQYEDGVIEERIAEIVADPQDPSNAVLHYEIFSPNVYKGKTAYKARTQMTLHNSQCLSEYYQTCKIYFPADNMNYLKDYPEQIHWLSIFEFWNNGNWTGEKYPFRVTVGLWKDPGAGSDLIYHVKADRDKKIGKFEDIWDAKAEQFIIPFDTWMELEVYIKEGDVNNGRFYMAVTPEGGTKEVLFDITNTTQHPDEKCPDGFTHIQPLKWYTSELVVDYLKDGGKSLEVYWDDWVVYKNKQP